MESVFVFAVEAVGIPVGSGVDFALCVSWDGYGVFRFGVVYREWKGSWEEYGCAMFGYVRNEQSSINHFC